jgi:hypothetical protein
MGAKRNAYRLLVGKPEGKRPLGRPRRYDGGWIILGWILERWDGVMWTGLIWLRIGTGEFGIEPTGSMKCWETIEWPNIWWSLE